MVNRPPRYSPAFCSGKDSKTSSAPCIVSIGILVSISRMVKKLRRLRTRSISGALRAVRDTESGLDSLSLGSLKGTATRSLFPDDFAHDENAPHTASTHGRATLLRTGSAVTSHSSSDRADPSLGVGVQIRCPRRQRYSRDSGRVDEVLKSGAIFPVAVMNQVLPGFRKPQSAIVTLRAICIIHDDCGCDVTPATWTSRCRGRIKNRT